MLNEFKEKHVTINKDTPIDRNKPAEHLAVTEIRADGELRWTHQDGFVKGCHYVAA